MAAILGLDDAVVEEMRRHPRRVVPANYNCPGQLTISPGPGRRERRLREAEGGRRQARPVLPVGGAFPQPLMEPARAELAGHRVHPIVDPRCPCTQNVDARPHHRPCPASRPTLIQQLTAPCVGPRPCSACWPTVPTRWWRWDPAKVLQGLFREGGPGLGRPVRQGLEHPGSGFMLRFADKA